MNPFVTSYEQALTHAINNELEGMTKVLDEWKASSEADAAGRLGVSALTVAIAVACLPVSTAALAGIAAGLALGAGFAAIGIGVAQLSALAFDQQLFDVNQSKRVDVVTDFSGGGPLVLASGVVGAALDGQNGFERWVNVSTAITLAYGLTKGGRALVKGKEHESLEVVSAGLGLTRQDWAAVSQLLAATNRANEPTRVDQGFDAEAAPARSNVGFQERAYQDELAAAQEIAEYAAREDAEKIRREREELQKQLEQERRAKDEEERRRLQKEYEARREAAEKLARERKKAEEEAREAERRKREAQEQAEREAWAAENARQREREAQAWQYEQQQRELWLDRGRKSYGGGGLSPSHGGSMPALP